MSTLLYQQKHHAIDDPASPEIQGGLAEDIKVLYCDRLDDRV